jgi:hypothetical protein
VLGALLIALIRNASALLDLNTFCQQVIIGVIIWIAAFWDRYRWPAPDWPHRRGERGGVLSYLGDRRADHTPRDLPDPLTQGS